MNTKELETEEALYLTLSEAKNLNRIFNIIGEVELKANYFTKSDIEDIYSCVGKVREVIEEMEMDQ